MAHTDGFFQGAMDNASGMATAIDIARHYAAIPQAQPTAHDGLCRHSGSSPRRDRPRSDDQDP